MAPDKNQILLSIVICTYNRSGLLRECLESVGGQTVDSALFEVIVVDNNSRDDTQAVAKEFTGVFRNYKIVFEPKQGLSNARNRGIDESSGSWIGYIDDDGEIRPNCIVQAFHMIKNFQFSCFGGKVIDVKEATRPQWYPKNRYPLPEEKKGEYIRELKTTYIPGGIMFFKKTVFDTIRFDPQLGMIGDKTGYSEDSVLQKVMRDRGMTIGFNPRIILDHKTLSRKYSISWQLDRRYKLEYNYWLKGNTLTISKLMVILVRMFAGVIIRSFTVPFRFLNTWIKRKDYHIENAILDWLGPFYKNLGKFVSGLRILIKID